MDGLWNTQPGRIYIYILPGCEIYIYIYRERERERERARALYYKGLDYVIMEAEKSHDLLSTSWKPRQVSGIIQSKCESLRPRGAGGVNPRPRTGED